MNYFSGKKIASLQRTAKVYNYKIGKTNVYLYFYPNVKMCTLWLLAFWGENINHKKTDI